MFLKDEMVKDSVLDHSAAHVFDFLEAIKGFEHPVLRIGGQKGRILQHRLVFSDPLPLVKVPADDVEIFLDQRGILLSGEKCDFRLVLVALKGTLEHHRHLP